MATAMHQVHAGQAARQPDVITTALTARDSRLTEREHAMLSLPVLSLPAKVDAIRISIDNGWLR